MGCGDTDGNLEKSFYQNFSPRKLCDERQDDVRGEHPVGRWERQVSSWVTLQYRKDIKLTHCTL